MVSRNILIEQPRALQSYLTTKPGLSTIGLLNSTTLPPFLKDNVCEHFKFLPTVWMQMTDHWVASPMWRSLGKHRAWRSPSSHRCCETLQMDSISVHQSTRWCWKELHSHQWSIPRTSSWGQLGWYDWSRSHQCCWKRCRRHHNSLAWSTPKGKSVVWWCTGSNSMSNRSQHNFYLPLQSWKFRKWMVSFSCKWAIRWRTLWPYGSLWVSHFPRSKYALKTLNVETNHTKAHLNYHTT